MGLNTTNVCKRCKNVIPCCGLKGVNDSGMLKENNQGRSRPLRDEALVCDPAVIIRTHGVIHVWTPGHVGKNIEHVHQLAGVQSTVSVLKQNNHDSEALIKQDQVQNKCTVWSISVPVYCSTTSAPLYTSAPAAPPCRVYRTRFAGTVRRCG